MNETPTPPTTPEEFNDEVHRLLIESIAANAIEQKVDLNGSDIHNDLSRIGYSQRRLLVSLIEIYANPEDVEFVSTPSTQEDGSIVIKGRVLKNVGYMAKGATEFGYPFNQDLTEPPTAISEGIITQALELARKMKETMAPEDIQRHMLVRRIQAGEPRG